MTALEKMEKPADQVLFEAIERAKARLADAQAAVVAETAGLDHLRAQFEELTPKTAAASE